MKKRSHSSEVKKALCFVLHVRGLPTSMHTTLLPQTHIPHTFFMNSWISASSGSFRSCCRVKLMCHA